MITKITKQNKKTKTKNKIIGQKGGIKKGETVNHREKKKVIEIWIQKCTKLKSMRLHII